ncbi:MAG: hypothetical protein V7647_186 [Acidobacteriota bacterium]|jgi:predicted anti-sigma-YlaC factor YlaD
MTCPAAEPLIARYADDPGALTAGERQQIEHHVAACDACRILLDDQRHVVRILQARPPATPGAAFTQRLAGRLDSEPQGVLALANWRAWTVTLTPVAAALILIAWLGVGTGTATTSRELAAAPETFTGWTEANATVDPAAVFLQPSSGDGLIEAVLTGAAAPAGERNAR